MFSVQHHLVLLVFLWFYYFTAVFFYLLVSIKLLSMKQNLRFCHLVCVYATFFLAHSTSQKTWSQTSCHGSTVGTDDVAQVHTSQPHPH